MSKRTLAIELFAWAGYFAIVAALAHTWRGWAIGAGIWFLVLAFALTPSGKKEPR